MLAGRKLLLADDSITIQKVVELTFADEGVQVIAVGSGTEAIEKLEEIAPDVVLADVFMPGMTGYQVCEYIKQSERLKHIPVMLLIGSFEPYDEAEAHRVGADDTLTKPFQSIRNLVDKVGKLLRGDSAMRPLAAVAETPTATPDAVEKSPPAAFDEAMTMELPKAETATSESQRIGTDELELMTADTRQLTPEMLAKTQPMEIAEDPTINVELEHKMETETQFATDARPEAPLDFGNVLLDLGQFEPASVFGAHDDILDIDLDGPALPMPRSARSHVAVAEVEPVMVVEPEAAVDESFADTLQWETVTESPASELVEGTIVEEAYSSSELVTGVTQELEAPEVQQVSGQVAPEPAANLNLAPAGQVTLDQCSPELIDAIAQRVVAQLSEKAVQEIAWEVVPQLAELMIKRRLEEKETETN